MGMERVMSVVGLESLTDYVAHLAGFTQTAALAFDAPDRLSVHDLHTPQFCSLGVVASCRVVASIPVARPFIQ